MKRTRRSHEAWQEILKQQVQSGLNAAAFCREHGLSTKTFYRWRKALRHARAKTPQCFVKVKTGSAPVHRQASFDSISLHYREVELRFPASAAPDWIASLMKALS